MCLFPEENQQPVLGGNRFFRRKVANFIGRETKTHILPTKMNENIANVSPSNNNYSFWNNITIQRLLSSILALRHIVDHGRTSRCVPMTAGSLQIDASVVSELHLEICTLFPRVSCIFQHSQRSIFFFCASRFFGAFEHTHL